jgi:hypothetical protein
LLSPHFFPLVSVLVTFVGLSASDTLVSVDDLLATFSEWLFSESCLHTTGNTTACERSRTTAKKDKAFTALEEAMPLTPI